MSCILFDWGDTLMQVYPQYSGAMVNWPEVAALPGAVETLAVLHSGYHLAVATNAQDSDETEIWAALQRVDLAEHLDKVYCFRSVGFCKPSQEFFHFILKDLDLLPEEVIMVGDDWEVDVQGAVQSGLRAIWLNIRSTEHCSGSGYQTIHSLLDLPQTLMHWGFR